MIMKTIHFYESNELREQPYACTTYKDFKNTVRTLDDLHTNETSALSFEYFDYYTCIIIHAANGDDIKFYKPIYNNIVINNSSVCKEIRVKHDLRKMWIAGMFDKYIDI